MIGEDAAAAASKNHTVQVGHFYSDDYEAKWVRFIPTLTSGLN